ncbi:hypothetical protein [Roseovarius sp. 2305UL8-3]|uniref:hypothetical protein n=1 Tax=Roseovarius conchicola TaxID=3121636 RepID=UPI0035293520
MRFLTQAFSTALALIVSATAALAAELVMVEQDGCHWCDKWNAEIGEIYPKTEESERAPLRRVNLRALPDDITFISRPIYTPTFVLVEEGRELGRLEGYPGADFFWPMLDALLDQHLITKPLPSAAVEPAPDTTTPKL